MTAPLHHYPTRLAGGARLLGHTLALHLTLFLLSGTAIRPDTRARSPRRLHGTRGDVPGWVMVTLMSALLVAGIYAVAGPALVNMFSNAINKVGGLK